MDNATCPAGHPATDRMTDGMPVPCLTPSCTYYRRPIAQVERPVDNTPRSSEHSTESEA